MRAASRCPPIHESKRAKFKLQETIKGMRAKRTVRRNPKKERIKMRKPTPNSNWRGRITSPDNSWWLQAGWRRGTWAEPLFDHVLSKVVKEWLSFQRVAAFISTPCFPGTNAIVATHGKVWSMNDFSTALRWHGIVRSAWPNYVPGHGHKDPRP